MITLYTFGPYFGLPDPSPFVTKTWVQLKMSGLPFTIDTAGFAKAPKRKLPYINDNGEIVADSTFIQSHLERRYDIDLDEGLSSEERAVGWALEKMCEEHLYWAIIDARWMVDANFNKGPRQFFQAAPGPLRPVIIWKIRRDLKRTLYGQGFGRHTRTEIESLAARDLDAIATVLGDKMFLFGDDPHAADASVFATVLSVLCPLFETGIRSAAQEHPNLVAYAKRGMARWFPDIAS